MTFKRATIAPRLNSVRLFCMQPVQQQGKGDVTTESDRPYSSNLPTTPRARDASTLTTASHAARAQATAVGIAAAALLID